MSLEDGYSRYDQDYLTPPEPEASDPEPEQEPDPDDEHECGYCGSALCWGDCQIGGN